MGDPHESRTEPDPERKELLRSAFESSPLNVVAEAVAVASHSGEKLYVDRDGEGWRWSLAHGGGVYPLLRVTARFLLCDYTRIMIGFRTLENGLCVLMKDQDEERTGVVWAILELDGPVSEEVAAQRIREALGPEAT